MLKLIRKNVTPPGGWRYVIESVGVPFIADNADDLVAKVSRYMRINNIPIPENLPVVIEDWLCHKMPDGICSDLEDKPWAGGYSAAPTDGVLNRTIILARSSVYVGQDLANKRALVCSTCSMKKAQGGGCASCNGVKNVLDDASQKRVSNPDMGYTLCDALGVFLRVLVHLSVRPDKLAGIERIEKTCWLNTES